MKAKSLALPHKLVHEDMEYVHTNAKKSFDSLSGSRVLLTGAGGFLGYYVILSILAWNDQHPNQPIHLTAVSRFLNGIPEWLKRLNDRKDFQILSRDVSKDEFLDDGPYEFILHAASLASPVVYRTHTLATMLANVFGLYHILERVVHNKNMRKHIQNILYFSSSEIYGDPPPEYIPTPESYRGNVSCTGPRACYDESKRFCETLCVNYVRSYSLPIVTVRPFNTYGPGMKLTDGRVIADFSRNILSNKDILVYSDGAPTRTFCYVTDAIVGYLKAVTGGRAGEAYNIGMDKPEISILDLAQRMARIGKKHFNYTGNIEHAAHNNADYLTDSPARRCPSIAKAYRELGYNPAITIDEGIYRLLMWYKTTS